MPHADSSQFSATLRELQVIETRLVGRIKEIERMLADLRRSYLLQRTIRQRVGKLPSRQGSSLLRRGRRQ